MTRPPSPSTKPSSILHLYAELLLHIRTVTLFASLRTAHTSETKAVLSADGETLTLTHEGQSASIRLPTQIAGGGTAALTLPQAPSKELTLRLQLQEKSPGLLRLRQGAENVVPWDARQLQEAESVECAQCGAQLAVANPGRSDGESHQARSESANGGGAEAPRVGVKTWLDLPNENWAEMMDFWHCHKPHEHNHGSHNHEGEEKGYAASNKLTARKGVGYVDLAYLLLAEEDCIGVKVRIPPASFPGIFSARWSNQTVGPLRASSFSIFNRLLLNEGQQEGGLAQPRLNQWRGFRYNCPRRTRRVAASSSTLSALSTDVVLAFCASRCLGFQLLVLQLKGRRRFKQDTSQVYNHTLCIPRSDFFQLSSQRSHLLCSSCNSHIGLFDHRSNGFRLWKWSLSVPRKESSVPQSYSPVKWVSAQLLSLIENQGVRKFTVIPDGGPEATTFEDEKERFEPIEIWVFTPDLSFSSSVPHSTESNSHTPTDPTRAMKVMWKPATHLQLGNEQGQAIDRQSLAVEEARLPEHVFVALKETLRNSGDWVPASARKMGEWNVGLLQRFAEEEI
ncbi:HECT-like ubiquitin-conjugating enzyme-binding-domain-containing protein [Phyllosticta capitalensis]|uniref:HECT-like ubiquitin-conjugating enzyme-binding-domain-containing protein n=1 Tax=Phyllosticta capitalensis TaxID=121624 RepID=A0ABR1YZJ1_9PEZI